MDHTAPDAKEATYAGDVGPGPRWFSCWTHGEWFNAFGRASDIWVATTNDQGRRNVYISLDYIYQNNQQDLPPCTWPPGRRRSCRLPRHRAGAVGEAAAGIDEAGAGMPSRTRQ
ncbi:hypothetical protein NGB36_28260 [Streptomyces sp. RB6PN25]|uniref:Uncharacterized protein n=1 Tax=Streptomyces humicola TaxID=2953240 RepID=A0ABT1Q4W1_9ACTN|nr:hypothetical protein [Streptomyces humicola]MCQ4084370.1 hypothetical protein [Streptomyces humicola]